MESLLTRAFSFAVMNLLLISVTDAVPAVREHFGRYPNDEAVSAAELRELCGLAVRYVRISEALLRYATQVGGKPSRN